jgi:hypothetical protein
MFNDLYDIERRNRMGDGNASYVVHILLLLQEFDDW